MPKKGRQAMMTMPRRTALQAIGLGLTACAAGAVSPRLVSAKESEAANFAPRDARELQKLSDRLAEIPRHRDFKSVPMIFRTMGCRGAEGGHCLQITLQAGLG